LPYLGGFGHVEDVFVVVVDDGDVGAVLKKMWGNEEGMGGRRSMERRGER
jgi:hypothetical protein